MIHPFEANVMNNGAGDNPIEFNAASVSGFLYLAVKDKKEAEAKAAAEKAAKEKAVEEAKKEAEKAAAEKVQTREQILIATKNDDLRVIALELCKDDDERNGIPGLIKKELVEFILIREAEQTDPE